MSGGFEINVHALREDIINFTRACAEEFKLNVFAQKFHPFDAILMSDDTYSKILSEDSPFSFFMCSLLPPNYPVTQQFPTEYPDSLYIPIPHVRKRTLPQISFGFRVRKGDSYHELSVKTWKVIGSEFKKISIPGLLINYLDGTSTIEKSFRYTKGAADEHKNGLIFGLPNVHARAEPMAKS